MPQSQVLKTDVPSPSSVSILSAHSPQVVDLVHARIGNMIITSCTASHKADGHIMSVSAAF